MAYFENFTPFTQVLAAVVQISDRKVSWGAFRLQYFEFVTVARKYFLSRP